MGEGTECNTGLAPNPNEGKYKPHGCLGHPKPLTSGKWQKCKSNAHVFGGFSRCWSVEEGCVSTACCVAPSYSRRKLLSEQARAG